MTFAVAGHEYGATTTSSPGPIPRLTQRRRQRRGAVRQRDSMRDADALGDEPFELLDPWTLDKKSRRQHLGHRIVRPRRLTAA